MRNSIFLLLFVIGIACRILFLTEPPNSDPIAYFHSALGHLIGDDAATGSTSCSGFP